jgi:pilus assembly protein CpaF
MFGRRTTTGPTAGTARFGSRGAPPDGGSPTAVAAPPEADRDALTEDLVARLSDLAKEVIPTQDMVEMPRGDLARRLGELTEQVARERAPDLTERDRRDIVTAVLNGLISQTRTLSELLGVPNARTQANETIEQAKKTVQPLMMGRIDVGKASALPRGDLALQIGDIVAEILVEEKIQLNAMEQRDLVTVLLNDMLGLGPLEPLLADESVTDIMVNGPHQVYVERKGKLVLTDVKFRDDQHVMNIATRIVSRIGRRVDESTPICDARLEDGSRVNIIAPPLAIDGPSISIRKFAKQKITLDIMERQNNLSAAMGRVLRIAARSRLNILISGGTGSGKTTLLNALSRMIDPGERVVTIEDAAELQLQQPHVVRLETRPPNLEGTGEITMRDLVKNALRMRPDRVILGEIRGSEALDMLQAMNTGHDGSMCTIHANTPREALTRLENMVAMAGVKLPNEAVRAQIAGAVNMVVQVSRMRDGKRRITYVSEVVGMEGEIITMQDLFKYEYKGEDADGALLGTFASSGLRPAFSARAQYFGLDRSLMEAMSMPDQG